MNPSILELVIVIAILVVVFTVLMKYFKWALNGVIIFILALILIYVVLRVLDYSDSTGAIGSLLNEIKEALGLNDPQTTDNVKELSNTVVETTKADEVVSKFNLKKIWEDIKAVLGI